jgi:hypothetical protein
MPPANDHQDSALFGSRFARERNSIAKPVYETASDHRLTHTKTPQELLPRMGDIGTDQFVSLQHTVIDLDQGPAKHFMDDEVIGVECARGTSRPGAPHSSGRMRVIESIRAKASL